MKPLQRATVVGQESEKIVALTMERYGLDRTAAIAKLEAYDSASEYWKNDLYQVQLRRLDHGLVHLNIRRIDGSALVRDWRHFQAIKNQLVGPECEAIELYPAESRLVDTSNKFHLWAVADPTFRFPIGFDDRDVQYDDTPGMPGLRQRPASATP